MRKINLPIPIVILFFWFISSSANKYTMPKLVINRDECNGAMNSLFSTIIIEQLKDNEYVLFNDYSVSEFKILNEPTSYTRKDLSIAGGEKIVLVLRPGQYRIKCVTQIENQNSYLNTKKDWESDFLYFALRYNSSAMINILPATDESGYCGGWNIRSNFGNAILTLREQRIK